MTDTFVRHLTDTELGEVVIKGPIGLLKCSDDVSHRHIVHEGCVWCITRLVQLISLHLATVNETKH